MYQQGSPSSGQRSRNNETPINLYNPCSFSSDGTCAYNNTSSTIDEDDFLQQSVRFPRSFVYDNEYQRMRMPAQSTPIPSSNLPSHRETFGSQIDYNLSWMPKSIELSDLEDSGRRPPSRVNLKYLQPEYNVAYRDSSLMDDSIYNPNQTSDIDSKFFSRQSRSQASKKTPKHESVLEWFDRSVEKEMEKRRGNSMNVGENLVKLDSPSPASMPSGKSLSKSFLLEASTSGQEIAAELRKERDSDLLEAVDKLAKAEAMIAFEGAVQAAEAAAAAAPPESAEEAAAEGAKGFQAEITSIVQHDFTGEKPIEVIGYVGITRPKKPKRTKTQCH